MAVPRRQPAREPDGDDLPRGSDGEAPLEAAALRYDPGREHAPRLVGHGKGQAAKKIMELAEEYDLPITQDPTLVSILGAIDVGAEVPPELYGVIAEVLAWAYRVDQVAGERSATRRPAA